MIRKFAAPLLSIALFASPALAQDTAPAASAAATASTTVDADPALWVVKDDDTTIYLFGTFHALRPNIDWFDDAVKTAFDKSDKVVFETDISNPAKIQAGLMKLGVSTDGKPFTDKMTADQKARYVGLLKDYGMPATSLDMFKPWAAGMVLSVVGIQKAGFDPNKGAERTLLAAAQEAGKTLGKFETVEEQLGFFASLPEDQQLEFLNSVTEDQEAGVKMLNEMLKDWSAGDPDALGKLMNDSMTETPELANILLYNRNERWATKIKTMLDTPGTVFIAVGSGHLAGPKSVQADLAKLGVKTVRINYE
ncbi:TraB/GumN family protein [Stakelama marina]|uniref:TraB/GumN family protein n=1 Tax=Stakelama marina TaxID=2826939 RepID=A0A8T4ICL2_9SPHN|nr:TraB/GumN family protein [Stakelama marina]MBR0552377.1 TraB/GumN family protein [Stakelama marina]